jgi:galactonate dehydratase
VRALKIEQVDTYLVGDRWMYLQIHTDNGLTGLGEAGMWGYPTTAERMIQAWTPYLRGKDPLEIEHHWQFLYRNAQFRGAAVGAALSAIDIALWDIAGKHFGVPAYQLLGGKTRDRIRLYVHADAPTVEGVVANARRRVADGFTAVRFNPLMPGFETRRHDALIDEAVQCVGAVRDAVGPGVDLCVEVHRRLSPIQALAFTRGIEPFRPFFCEDPIVYESIKSMAQFAPQMPVPVGIGERLHTIYEFRELLEGGGIAYVRPDLCLAGGLTHVKKIAALAEAHLAGVAPHITMSPVSIAACAQLDACIPNQVLQEYALNDQPPESKILKRPLQLEGGFLRVPEAPGIGVELNVDALRQMPHFYREIDTPLHDDGSVADK